MGSPEWGSDPRFATKPDRVANWDALHALMSEWSRRHPTSSGSPTGAGRACAELPAARAGRAARLAATGASRLLAVDDRRRQASQGAGPALRAEPSRGARQAGRAGQAAAHRRPRARFLLGHRRADDDPLSRGDGRRGHQGRGAGPRRSRPRQRTAHRARPGQEGHRPRPEETRGGRHRPRPRRALATCWSRISRPG